MESSPPIGLLVGIAWGIWCLVSLGLFPLNLLEILKEKDFIKKAKRTKGKVISFLNAVVGVARIGSPTDALKNTNSVLEPTIGLTNDTKTNIGVFLKVKFEANGYIYEINTKKVYQQDEAPKEVEVLYNPEDPYDAMLDGFYITGKSKYVLAGFSFFGVLTDIGALIYYFIRP